MMQTTKDAGVKSKSKLAALVVAFNKKKASMSPEQRKKVAARIKALKQGQGMSGTLKGE